jgi:hypothetical protein
MKASIVGLLAAVTLAAPSASSVWAQTRTPWIHVRVEEPKKDSKVSVNVPLTVAEAALALAPRSVVADGKIHIGDKGRHLSVADLRRMWKELRTTGDAELVSIEEKAQTVKITRVGEHVRVRVDSPAETETVDIDVPVTALDALFSGEGESLDLRAALAVMQKHRGEVIKVEDGDSKVRIWIDEEM